MCSQLSLELERVKSEAFTLVFESHFPILIFYQAKVFDLKYHEDYQRYRADQSIDIDPTEKATQASAKI
jgi:hypothetical protein